MFQTTRRVKVPFTETEKSGKNMFDQAKYEECHFEYIKSAPLIRQSSRNGKLDVGYMSLELRGEIGSG